MNGPTGSPVVELDTSPLPDEVDEVDDGPTVVVDGEVVELKVDPTVESAIDPCVPGELDDVSSSAGGKPGSPTQAGITATLHASTRLRRRVPRL